MPATFKRVNLPRLFFLMGQPGWPALLAAFLLGASLTLAFAPVGLGYWAFVPLVFLFWQLRQTLQVKQGFFLGYSFGLGLFLSGVSWVYVAIHVYGKAHPLLAGSLTGLFIAFIALFIGLFGALSVYLLGRIKNPRDNWRAIPILAATWLMVEWFRSWFLTGFPWLSVGYSQIDTVLAAYAPLLGVYGVSFIAALIAASLLFLHRGWIWSLPVVLVAVATPLKSVEWTSAVDKPLSFTIIQGNVEQATRWNREQFNHTLELYTRLTNQHWDSDVIIWPENSVPMFYHRIAGEFFHPLERRAQQMDTDLLIGLPVMDVSNKRYYNSLMSFGSSWGVYKKQHLVPFGEYVPLEGLLRGLIDFFNLPMSSFSPGAEEQSLLSVKGVPLASSICYEDVFPEEMINEARAAQLLVNVSNNGWYGRSFAPYQHLEMARMRALENGRELVRSTTNGISAFVDSRGQIKSQTTLFETETLSDSVQPREGLTPYMRWGNYPLLIVGVLLLGFGWLSGRRRG